MPQKHHASQLEELAAKRAELIDELTSDQHYEETPTLCYGQHDPFEVPIAFCDSCNSTARVVEITAGPKKTRWAVVCTSCNKRTDQPQKDRWLAALLWNGVNLATQCYKSLPLFGLAQLTPAEAGDKISKIRHNLVLRIGLCAVDRAIAERTNSVTKPGVMYQLRLEAYLKWCMHAHRLIKVAKGRADGRARMHNQHLQSPDS